jgi:hypothetical protein
VLVVNYSGIQTDRLAQGLRLLNEIMEGNEHV